MKSSPISHKIKKKKRLTQKKISCLQTHCNLDSILNFKQFKVIVCDDKQLNTFSIVSKYVSQKCKFWHRMVLIKYCALKLPKNIFVGLHTEPSPLVQPLRGTPRSLLWTLSRPCDWCVTCIDLFITIHWLPANWLNHKVEVLLRTRKYSRYLWLPVHKFTGSSFILMCS